MLSHKKTDGGRDAGQNQPRDKSATDGIHVARQHFPLIPAFGQVVDLIEIVPDAPDGVVGAAGQCAVFIVKLHGEDVLKDGAGDGDADGTTSTAEGVARGRDDGLVLVLDGGDHGDERDGQHGAVAQAAGDEEDVGSPGGRVQVEGDVEARADDEQGHRHARQEVVAARRAHDEADAQRARRHGRRRGDEAQPRLRRALRPRRLQVDRHVVQRDEHRHGREPVGEAGREHRPVPHKPHRDNRLRGHAVFDVDENQEGEEGEREDGEDEGVRPWELVAAAVEAEKEEDEGDDEDGRTEEVDSLQSRLVCFFDRDFYQEKHEEGRDHNEGDLDQEGPAPADPVVQPAAKNSPEPHAQPEDQVSDPLPDSPPTEWDEVRRNETRDRVETSAAHAGDYAAEDDDPCFLRESTDQAADAEEDVGEDEPGAAAEDVGQLPTERLARGIGDEVAGGEPRKERERVEFGGYRSS